MPSKRTSKRSGLDNQALREFRSNVAKLKKKGVVSSRVDARSQKATKYMRAKVRKFADVLSGEAIAVKAKKDVREKYTSAGVFEERGSFLVVPKEHKNQRARIKKGKELIEIITPLKWGEKREVVLPSKGKTILDYANQAANDPDAFDKLKKGDEQFAFYLYGHTSGRGTSKAFVDANEFADYVLRNYQHLFKGKAGREAVKHFSLIRFKAGVDDVPPLEEDDEYYEEMSYNKPRRIDAKGRNNSGRKGTYEKQRDATRAAKKRKARANETPEQSAARKEKNRIRSAQWRQRKFEAK